jgi:tetratricopeptide (TPR) repeat protein
LGKLSYYLAYGLLPASFAGGASCAESLFIGQAAGLTILIFYFTLGFLFCYVWTTIYFSRDLNAQLMQLEQQKDTLQRLKQAADKIMPAKASVILSAEASISANQLDKAMASIDEALKNDPNNGLAVMTKARILKRQASQTGQPDRDKLLKEALAYADQAITLLPDKGEPIYNKACYQALLNAKGLKSDVLKNLKSAFRLNPGLRQAAKDDHDLAPLKQDVDFVKLMGKASRRGA